MYAFHKGMKSVARSGVALSQGPQFAMGLHPNNNGTRRGQSVLECAPQWLRPCRYTQFPLRTSGALRSKPLFGEHIVRQLSS